MGPSSVLTTLQGYGYVSVERQSEILTELSEAPSRAETAGAFVDKVFELIKQRIQADSAANPPRLGYLSSTSRKCSSRSVLQNQHSSPSSEMNTIPS